MRTNKVNNLDFFTEKANEEFNQHIKTQSKKALQVIDQLVNWDALLQPIEKAIDARRSDARAGRPRFGMKTIVKCFLLQYIFDLSDPRLEEEIADRRSFQIFLEINSGDSIPDETTICRYREMFSKLGLDKVLFESFKKQLSRRNLILERGTIVDATIIKAQAKPESGRDKDATFTKKRKKTYYGYKGHIGMDLGTDIIHSVEFTPANVHDSNEFESVILGKEQTIYADKGYASKKRKDYMVELDIDYNILEKGTRNHPLTKQQKALNKQLSKIRNRVERPFSYMKHVLGYERCRYYDLPRNRFQFMLCATIYNMRKLITWAAA